MPHPFRTLLVLVILAAPLVLGAATPARCAAQVYAYPIPWPQSAGGTIVAVPIRDAEVRVYHRRDVPQGSGWDVPFTGPPERVLSAPAGEPILLRAPEDTPPAEGDDLFVFLTDQPLVISASDDERYNPGSPDRIYFVPATSGTYRGRTFYGYSSAGWPANRIRVRALSSAPTHAEIAAWDGTAWVPVGALDIAASEVGVFDPPATYPDTAYRIETDEDALVLEGYLADNATVPAVDVTTGGVVGDDLWGYGHRYDLRAIGDLGYTVEARPEAGGPWTTVATGTLRAGERASGDLPSRPARYSMLRDENNQGDYVRVRTTGGRGWAIIGTVDATWNGYFLPAQAEESCVFGAAFLTPGQMRSLVVLPNAGTTVRTLDEGSGTLLETYTSTGPWEVHHVYRPEPTRVELGGGIGALLAVGVGLGGTECASPGGTLANCGILEGGYTVPSLGGFQCSSAAESLGECAFSGSRCRIGPSPRDAGTTADAGALDAGALDAGARLDAGGGGMDGAVAARDGGAGDGAGGGCGCRAARRGATGGGGVLLVLLAALARRARRGRRAPRSLEGVPAG